MIDASVRQFAGIEACLYLECSSGGFAKLMIAFDHLMTWNPIRFCYFAPDLIQSRASCPIRQVRSATKYVKLKDEIPTKSSQPKAYNFTTFQCCELHPSRECFFVRLMLLVISFHLIVLELYERPSASASSRLVGIFVQYRKCHISAPGHPPRVSFLPYSCSQFQLSL